MNAGVTILVFVIVFAQIYFGTLDRRIAVLLGAGTIFVYGLMAGFMTPRMVIDSIYFEVLALVFGMSAISMLLARSGLFSLIAKRTVTRAMGNGWWVMVSLSLVTYSLSLAVNNMATMVVILPVTLTVCLQMKLNPAPLLIAEIIASNLGGASTMVGDFPNMIISSVGSLHFIDFIGGMMAPCVMLLAVMLCYFQVHRAKFDPESSSSGAKIKLTPDFEEPVVDRRLMNIGLTILSMVLVGFLFTEVIGLRPGWIAVTAGAFVLIFAGRGWETDWFTACGGQDILFFVGLFIMVGGLVAAGTLDGVLWFIENISGGNSLPMMLVLMWVAAVSTIFLNAGAATAFFIPVATNLNEVLADPTVYWALSLGVLAGSSAALTGATAGPVASSHLDRFVKDHPEMRNYMTTGAQLDFLGYLRWGIPIWEFS